MGLFSKIKNMFKSTEEEKVDVNKEIEEVEDDGLNPLAIDQEEPVVEEKEVEEKKEKKGLFHKKEEEKKSVKVYEKGLTKSRQGFVSRLADLTNIVK